jgi:hypothetical protein
VECRRDAHGAGRAWRCGVRATRVQNRSVEPLRDVWRTEDRLHTDDATIARLCELAAGDPAIREVIDDLAPARAGNGSVLIPGVARHDGTPALLKLGARQTEREWMAAVDAVTTDVVPHVFGIGESQGVGWLVLERCPRTLDRDTPAHVAAVVVSAARYQQAATAVSVGIPTMDPDWLRETIAGALAQDCPGDLDGAVADVEESWAFVVTQCGLAATHGDLQVVNAVARREHGPALLIDPMPMATAWAWDSAYLEAVLAPYQPTGTRADAGAGLVHELARARDALGLPTPAELHRVEQLVLGWAAAHWWRIAPWRHTNEKWRDWVARRVHALRW